MPSAGMSGISSWAAPPPRSTFSSPAIPSKRSSGSSSRHGKVDLVGRSFGIIKFTIKGMTYDVALPRTDAPRDAAAGVKGHKDFVIAADPFLPVEKDLETARFPGEQHGPPPLRRDGHRPVRGPEGHPRPPPPGDQPGRLPRRPAPRPPGGPVRLGPRLPDRSGDLRDGQGRRPLRPERRTGGRGALQDPPRFAEALCRPRGAVPGRDPRKALSRALSP